MRTMNFVRYFNKLGDIDILCAKNKNCLPVLNSPFRNEFILDYSNNQSNNTTYLQRVIDKLLHNKSWLTQKFSPEAEKYIRSIVIEGGYSHILCRYISEAYPLLELDSSIKSRIMLDVDDILTETLYDADTCHISGLSRVNKTIDKLILRNYYAKCMEFGAILYCSNEDKNKITDTTIFNKCFVVPNVYQGLELPKNYIYDGYGNVNNLLFVGHLSYEPNYQGLTWFINQVFPQLLKQYNDLKLYVVGRDPHSELIELIQQQCNIELYANPPDILPFYDKCGILIVPLFAGGGTRIKILEAGFAYRPVISTEIGAYGLGLAEGKDIMIFKDPEGFVNKYMKLRNDRELYSTMVQYLSKFITNNFSCDNFSKSLDVVVRKLAN